MKHGKDQCYAEKALGMQHTCAPSSVTRRSHGKWCSQGILHILLWRFVPVDISSQHCGCLQRNHAYLVGSYLRGFLLSVISYLVQTLTQIKMAVVTQPNSGLTPHTLPAEVAQQAWCSLESTKLHKPKTSVESDPQLTSSLCAFWSQEGQWGSSPRRLHNSHGKGKRKAINSCCGQLEHHRKVFRACFCCLFRWGEPGAGPGKYQNFPDQHLGNWDQD